MTTLIEIWKEKKDFFNDKTLSQIIKITGDGELKDGNTTSKEIREFLSEIPSKQLVDYSNQCLNVPSSESGNPLQDVINQFGKRLGFTVEEGLYRGKRNQIGFDGIWRIKNEYSFIIEIKTTDSFRIDLDRIVGYKNALIEKGIVDKDNSSILIIVGRDDTGGLEAQIRGSKHAWNIRLLSIEALTKLLELRETVDDIRILKQINNILKPLEYTRLDKLIDLLLITSQDNQPEIEDEYEKVSPKDKFERQKANNERESPVGYHEDCIEVISKRLNKTFIKQSKSTYQSSDNEIGLTCAVSKLYPTKHTELYWYAFHPHQREFLEEFHTGYVSFGCGKQNILLIPLARFLELNLHMNTTTTDTKMYWHVKIHNTNNRFEIEQPQSPTKERIDISQYLIK